MRSLWLAIRSGGRPGETDVQSSEPEAAAGTRLSGADEDEIRPQPVKPTPSQGPQAARGDGTGEVEHQEGGGGEGGRYRFPRSARISRASEIRPLTRLGERTRTGHFDVFVAASPSLRTRLALVVPKHGRNIVARNRLKRRMREAVRLVLLPSCTEGEAALDILIRARPEAYGLEYGLLKAEIGELATQLCSQSSS